MAPDSGRLHAIPDVLSNSAVPCIWQLYPRSQHLKLFYTAELTALLFAAIVTLAGCQTLQTAQTSPVVKEAEHVRGMLLTYIDNDADTLSAIEAPLAVLESVYSKLQDESDTPIIQHAVNNMALYRQAGTAWQEIVMAVTIYNKETNKPVPDELENFRVDVQSAWNEIYTAWKVKDGAVLVKDFALLVAKISAFARA